ncbi:right-handed parallel beta-helix repeat-containing protein [Dyella caseinilytica]|uniref:Right-handed parallel beta-helix repeat-containing protein n=1 Tax=Dyella caseinilytica TaxID=1849581 RepID=A0ABX7H1H3_9GAMM|nr:right-handed parallel beta-helix repeat-containing protein [Dyella caseinilytica]QRN55265.1 right-handed parallel beta-helix repeat-containing protein [Dyella caseinilytica]GGA00560.1 hypothetical protein GCM10011408_21870 [Dyella caseinilytica]
MTAITSSPLVVSVMNYGATGNGTTDDGPAIQAAANAAASAGLRLYFPYPPGGSYFVQTYIDIPGNSSWFGDPGTVINISPTCSLGPVSIGGSNRAIYANAVSNIKLVDLVFESSSTGLAQEGVSIAFNNVANAVIKGCSFNNFGDSTYYAQGIVFLCSNGILVKDSMASGNSGDGFAFSTCTNFQFVGNDSSSNGDWGCATTVSCNNGIVKGNIFTGNASVATGADRCTNMTFSDNLCINNAYGVRICRYDPDTSASQYITVSGNIVNGAKTVGISVEQCTSPACVSVTGNVIAGSNGPGMNISDSCLVTVAGNSIDSTNGASILIISYTAAYETGRITVTGNTLSLGTYGVQQVTGPGTITQVTIGPNNISDMSAGFYSLLTSANFIEFNPPGAYIDTSNPTNIPSGFTASTATAGGAAIPATCSEFVYQYVGGQLRKYAVFNP